MRRAEELAAADASDPADGEAAAAVLTGARVTCPRGVARRRPLALAVALGAVGALGGCAHPQHAEGGVAAARMSQRSAALMDEIARLEDEREPGASRLSVLAADGDARVRARALRALARLQEPLAIGAIERGLRDTDRMARREAAFAIETLGLSWGGLDEPVRARAERATLAALDAALDASIDATHADAPHADATHADATHADATHADAKHADATHADASHADATHADATHADAPHADAPHADATHADATHADAPHADAPHADVTALLLALGAVAGDAGVERLRGLVDDPRPAIATAAATALGGVLHRGKRAWPGALPADLGVGSVRHARVYAFLRHAAAVAAGKSTASPAALFVAALVAPEHETRALALKGLAALGDTAHLDAVRSAAMNDPAWQVRVEAVRALAAAHAAARTDDRPAIGALAAAAFGLALRRPVAADRPCAGLRVVGDPPPPVPTPDAGARRSERLSRAPAGLCWTDAHVLLAGAEAFADPSPLAGVLAEAVALVARIRLEAPAAERARIARLECTLAAEVDRATLRYDRLERCGDADLPVPERDRLRARLLGRAALPDRVGRLLALARSSDRATRALAVEALAHAAPAPSPLATPSSASPATPARASAAPDASDLRRARAAVRAALDDADPPVVATAAESAAALHDAAALPALLATLPRFSRPDDAEVVESIAAALGALLAPPPSTVPNRSTAPSPSTAVHGSVASAPSPAPDGAAGASAPSAPASSASAADGDMREPAIAALVRLRSHPVAAVRLAARDALRQLGAAGIDVPAAPPPPIVARAELAPPDATHLRLVTEKGVVVIELARADAPVTTRALVDLARRGFYDGLSFHRVVPDFVTQGGDPRGDGWGGPGYTLRCELSPLRYRRGTVGMALAGKDTGGSQLFVAHGAQPHLDGKYTIVGRVVAGMDVVDTLLVGDRILRAEATPR